MEMNERLRRLVAGLPVPHAMGLLQEHWKSLCCVTLVNICLTAPVYLYGVMDSAHRHIAPSLWFTGFHLIASPWIYGGRLKAAQQNNSLAFNGCLIAFLSLIIFTGISTSSLFLSPGAVSSAIALIILYGLIGGIGSCFIMAMTWNLLQASVDNPILLNFSFSAGHALTQLLLPSIFSAMSGGILYVLLGCLSLLTVPVYILLAKLTATDEKPVAITDELDFYASVDLEEASRYVNPPSLQRFNVSLPTDLEDLRKNQSPEVTNELNSAKPEWKATDVEQSIEDYKLMTSDGVEVMDIIYEESEPESLGAPSTIGQHDDDTMDLKTLENAYEEINRRYSNLRASHLPMKTYRKAKRWTSHTLARMKSLAFRQVINPVRRASVLFKVYPSIFVKTFDAYTYIMFITTLPRLAAPSSTIYLAVGLPWLASCWTTLYLTDDRLKKWQHHLTVGAMTSKFFGYYLLYALDASFWVFSASILVSAAQAVQFLVLDVVIRSLFSARRWTYTRGCIYSCSGCLLVLSGVLTEVLTPSMAAADIFHYFIVTPHILSSGLWIFYQLYYRISQVYEDNLGLG